jgi:hypothetical protein
VRSTFYSLFDMRRAVAAALLATIASNASAQLSRLDSVVPALMKQYDVPGAALAVVAATLWFSLAALVSRG